MNFYCCNLYIIKSSMINLHNKVEKLTSIHKFYHYKFNGSIYDNNFGLITQNLLTDNFDKIIESMKNGEINNYQQTWIWASTIECELRQFIVLIYTKYQQYLDNVSDNYNNKIFKSWQWYIWIKENFENLLCVYTFNYDMIFEKILESLSIKYKRIGLINEKEGFPIIKNHGSIDFDSCIGNFTSSINRRNLNADKYININRLVDTDVTFSINKIEELNKLRMYPDIVLPTQYSYQLDLKWVKKGLNYYKHVSDEIDCFVIVGFSYWDVDEKEFNLFIDNLSKGKVIDFYIVNPKAYSDDLKGFRKFIESRHHNYIGITNGVPW